MLLAIAALGSLLIDTVWIRTPPAVPPSAGAPDVHAVELTEDQVVVHSAGVSLAYLGLLQSSPWPAGVRQFAIHLPRHPQAAGGRHAPVPAEVAGVFVNGMPIYNHFLAASYQGQNLWHFDRIAGSDDGTLTATGHPDANREHGGAAGLLEALAPGTGKHSPLIGYALDGYPVYGPWGYVDGTLRRMRSSYRLRKITGRTTWADDTALTPGQYGPEVDRAYPLGTFAEDYEYVEGWGDLDRFNGRFAATPEYPGGTYAYFLSTDEAGRLAFPYLLASEFYGAVPVKRQPMRSAGVRRGISFTTGALETGKSTTLEFAIDARVLEFVHEKPLHVMVISDDLAGFDHIHPEQNAAGAWDVEYTFRHAGKYRVFAEFTAPGEDTRTESFEVAVAGEPPKPEPLVVTPKIWNWVELIGNGTFKAGEDVELKFRVSKELEPYLGAWAHFAITNQGFETFLHAHPLTDSEAPMPPGCTMHSHGVVPLGPSPSEVRTVVRFEQAGLYKIWAQFQVAGRVEVATFVVRVRQARSLASVGPESTY
jgi:hypothetical protein